MGWSRHQQPSVVPIDARRQLDPSKVTEISTLAGPTVETATQRFDIAEWNRRNRERSLLRTEAEARRAAVLLPYRAGVATAGAGGVSWIVTELLTGPAGALLATAATPITAAVVLLAARLAYRHRLAEWSRTFAVASVSAVGWVLGAALLGPAAWPVLGAVLLSGGVWVSRRWLRAHRAPGELPPTASTGELLALDPAPELPSAPDDEMDADQRAVVDFADRWRQLIATNLLRGCHLTCGQHRGTLLGYVLQLVGGTTLTDVRGKQEAIAAALGLDPMQLAFDHVPPSATGFRDTSQVAVQVILSSPITGPVFFTRPRWALTGSGYGLIDLGPYVDGQRAATVELFRPSGMFSTVVIGSTGKGKSSVVNGVVVSARSSGRVITLYLDPKGSSSTDLARHATVTELGLDRAELFTRCVEELVEWLGKQSSLDGRTTYSPDYRVAYLVVVDECDMLFSIKGMGDRWGTIAKTGRSYGLGLLLATQYAGMKAFGNSELLRSSVRAGNVVLQRTESNTSDALIAPDLPKSTTLPRDPGYLYLSNTTSSAAAVRSAWLLTSDERIPPGYPDELRGWNADVALSRYPDAPLCPIGRRALTPLLDGGTQEERQAARAAQLRTEIAAYLRGATPKRVELGRAATSTLAGIQGLADRLARLPGPLADVIPLHRSHGPVGLRDAERSALRAMQRLPRSAAGIANLDLVAETGLADSTLHKTLDSLAGKGLVTRVRHGRWRLTDHGQAVRVA